MRCFNRHNKGAFLDCQRREFHAKSRLERCLQHVCRSFMLDTGALGVPGKIAAIVSVTAVSDTPAGIVVRTQPFPAVPSRGFADYD